MILVFLAGFLWSTVGLGIRLIEDANVWQILMYRSVSLSLFLALVIKLRTGRGPVPQLKSVGLPGVVGALGLVAAYSGGIYSIQVISVANALLLFASAPFMAALLGWIVLGETVRRATLVAIAVAIIGIGVMVYDQISEGNFIGNLAALGSAAGFAVFTVALRYGRSNDMMPTVFLSGVFAFVITLTICTFTGMSLVLSVNDGGVAIAMGVAQVGAGLVLYTIGSKVVPAVELTLLSLSEVILGPIWVWLFLGETVAANIFVGGGILLAAIVGNALSGVRRKPPVYSP